MTVRIEDLKVGTKVKLVDEEPSYHITGGFISEMRKFLGGVYTVKRVFPWDRVFSIAEDKNNYIWDVRLVEKIVDDTEKQNKVYTSFWDIKKDSIEEDYYKLEEIYLEYTNQNYEFEKCIVNDNYVIGIFKVGKRTYKGIAKCQPGDEFSLAKGLSIAMLRAYKSYLDREIKKLY